MISKQAVTFVNNSNQVIQDIRENEQDIKDNDQDILINNEQIVTLNDNVITLMNTSNSQQQQLNNKAQKEHKHNMNDINGLQNALNQINYIAVTNKNQLNSKINDVEEKMPNVTTLQNDIDQRVKTTNFNLAMDGIDRSLSGKANTDIYNLLQQEKNDRVYRDDDLYNIFNTKVNDLQNTVQWHKSNNHHKNQQCYLLDYSRSDKKAYQSGLKCKYTKDSMKTINENEVINFTYSENRMFIGQDYSESSWISFDGNWIGLCSPGDGTAGSQLQIYDEDDLTTTTKSITYTGINNRGQIQSYSTVHFKTNFREKSGTHKNYWDVLNKIKLYTFTFKYDHSKEDFDKFDEKKKQRILKKRDQLHLGIKWEELKETGFGNIFRQNVKDKPKQQEFKIEERMIDNTKFQYYIIFALQSFTEFELKPIKQQLQLQQQLIEEYYNIPKNEVENKDTKYLQDQIDELDNKNYSTNQLLNKLNNKFDLYVNQTSKLIKDQRDIQKGQILLNIKCQNQQK